VHLFRHIVITLNQAQNKYFVDREWQVFILNGLVWCNLRPIKIQPWFLVLDLYFVL
jgi:hypothetical protein